MGYCYLTITVARPNLTLPPWFYTTAATPPWRVTSKEGWQRPPKKPKRMLLKFLVLLVLSTLCLPENSPSVTEDHISVPLLTTSLMSCMELEKALRVSFLAQGYHPYELEAGPLTYIVKWTQGRQKQILVGITASPPEGIETWCITRKDLCTYKMGMKLHVTFARPRYGHEHCEVNQ